MGDDEDRQAQVLHEYLTTFFSHPAVEGVTMWGFWEGQTFRSDAALYRNDWSEKPALVAYQALLFDEWWTDESGQTTETGELLVRGFKGDYEIQVTVPGGSETQQMSLLEGETVEIVILPGDYDQSGEIDPADVDLLFAAYGAAAADSQYDLDNSGTVDFEDAEILITRYGHSTPGDLDLNGRVDVLGDAFALIANLGATSGVGYADGDINGDGQVTVLGDAFLLIANLSQ